MTFLLEEVGKAVERRWPLIRVAHGRKEPAKGIRYSEEPPPTLEELTEWVQGGGNVGLRTGSISGIGVVDVDPENSGEVPDGIPQTATVETPSGGLHFYYKIPAGIEIRNSASQIADGVDVRGEGGYVVFPGSRRDDVEKVYQWKEGLSPDDVELAPFPDFLLQRLRTNKDKKHRKPPSRPRVSDDAFDLRIEFACSRIRVAEMGTRNDTLNAESYKLGLLVPEGLDQFDAFSKLVGAAKGAGLTQEESRPTVKSGLDGGIQDSMRSLGITFEPIQNSGIFIPDFPPVSEIDFAKLPPREWLIRHRLIPGYLTATIAPGGVGKSMFTILEGLAVATGKSLTGMKVEKTGPVLLYNLEDPLDELKRRIWAACVHHGIDPASLNNLYLVSGFEQPLVLAKEVRGEIIPGGGKEWLGRFIEENGIVLCCIDPFVRSHMVNENDNVQMDIVTRELSSLAMERQCAISVVHHSRKGSPTDGAGDADSARGASSFINGARIVSTLTTMSSDEGKKYGLDPLEARSRMKLVDAKLNLSPPAEMTRWFVKESVHLPNGDDVGVVSVDEDIRELQSDKREDVARILVGFIGSGNRKLAKECAEYLARDHYELLGVKAQTIQRSRLADMLREGIVVDGCRVEFVTVEQQGGKHWIEVKEEFSKVIDLSMYSDV